MPRRIIQVLACILTWLAAPSAYAQSPSIAQCVAEERKAEREAHACIGRVADPCQETPEGASTQGQVACIRAESKQWDDLLTAEYRALLKALPAAMVPKVRDAQRQWLSLREADCALPYTLLQGGTMAQPIAASCYQRRTAERTIQVMRWHGMVGNNP